MSDNMTFLDGNTAAGDLRDIFAVDLSGAMCQCENCGRTSALADSRMYGEAPGLVLRCAACEHVLLRFARTGERVVFDLRGLAYVAVAV